MSQSPSSQRARWAAAHPVLLGVISGGALALGGIALFDQSPLIVAIVSALFGIGVWLGWREGGWLKRIEARHHDLGETK